MKTQENDKYYEQKEKGEPMHTPTPWEYDMRRDTHDSIIFKSGSKAKDGFIHPKDGGIVGSSEWIWLKEEDAKFIVKACNAHEELVEACKYALDWINSGSPKFDKIHTRTMLESALSKARG